MSSRPNFVLLCKSLSCTNLLRITCNESSVGVYEGNVLTQQEYLDVSTDLYCLLEITILVNLFTNKTQLLICIYIYILSCWPSSSRTNFIYTCTYNCWSNCCCCYCYCCGGSSGSLLVTQVVSSKTTSITTTHVVP